MSDAAKTPALTIVSREPMACGMVRHWLSNGWFIDAAKRKGHYSNGYPYGVWAPGRGPGGIAAFVCGGMSVKSALQIAAVSMDPAPPPQPRPRVGDETWFVQWCVQLGMADDSDPESEYCRDNDKHKVRRAKTKEEAIGIAKEVYPEDQYGAVSYWPAEFVPYDEDHAARWPHAGYWEATGDTETYEGPDA